MKELIANGATLPEAYHNALWALWRSGEKVPCPAWKTSCIEAATTLVVDRPLEEPRISKLFPGTPYDLEKYRQEMLDGIMDFKVGDGWNYTYHDRIENYPIYDHEYDDYDVMSQIRFVVRELKNDPNSRRAVIDVRDNVVDANANDPACLQHIQYFIRNGKLECMVLFRSNDLLEATFMNAYALICLQERIANELGVEVGTYTHRANSCHVYAKDWERFKAAAERTDKEPLEDLTYYFKGEWDELMEAEKPRIKELVEGLKNG